MPGTPTTPTPDPHVGGGGDPALYPACDQIVAPVHNESKGEWRFGDHPNPLFDGYSCPASKWVTYPWAYLKATRLEVRGTAAEVSAYWAERAAGTTP